MMRLGEIATGVHGELIGSDARIEGVSTDTRTLARGELFVALKGPNFDGHAFLEKSAAAGAAGALVERQVEYQADAGLPLVRVADTYQALGELAGTWRERFTLPLVAVTGSNGKTTVKEMIGAILNARAPTLVSTGNLNNRIGVPLVLCGLRSEHQFAVVEMGMNHPGEIAYLASMARPTVAVITNAAAAHLEGLGSLDAVADAKGEIMTGLAPGGVAVLNRDDAFFDQWSRMAGDHRVLSFGLDGAADVHASDHDQVSGRFRLHLRGHETDVALPLPGRHNLANALAAAAAASAAGVDIAGIRSGLERVRPVPGRLCARDGLNGSRLLDDSYNANPASVSAGIDVLAARSGRRVLVLGDMGELGSGARAMHRQVGEHARDRGIDGLHAIGAMSAETVRAFGAGAVHHHNPQALVNALVAEADAGTTFLVKGSRSMRMDRVVAALAAAPATQAGGH